MRIYIDSDFKCHISDTGNLTPVETDIFDGKCRRYIEGYRFVPTGQTWTRPDGKSFTGEMSAPWQDSHILEAAQAAYEEAQIGIADMKAALEVLGVQP